MNNNQNLNDLQSRIRKNVEKSDNLGFLELFNSQELKSTVEEYLPEYRERKYPPLDTLAMFVAQVLNADSSCQNIVNTVEVQKIINRTPLKKTKNTDTGSYCTARKRLPLELARELAKRTGKLVCKQLPSNWYWKGRAVKLVDGSTITMPDTLESQAIYPQQSNQAPGLGFPICRILAIICLGSGCVIDAGIGPYKGKGADELTILRSLLDSLNTKDILLGDALFGSYFTLLELQSRGIDGVFEQHGSRKKSTDFRKGAKLGKLDHLIIYDKPKKKPDWMTQDDYDAAPDTITVREVKVRGKILVTTITCPKEASKKELKDLYKDRWHVELDLRNIKDTMGMGVFSCKSPEMVEKEMWVYMLAYNSIRLIMAQSAYLADILPRQISFKHSLQIWVAFRQQGGTIHDDECLIDLCILIAENIVGNRPGRIEPREVKRRPKPYKLLTKRRDKARKHIIRHGHPQKQK